MWRWILVAFLAGFFVAVIGAVLGGYIEVKDNDVEDKHDGLDN